MARSGAAVDETVPCRGISASTASERLLGAATPAYRAVSVGANRFRFARSTRPRWALITGCILAPTIVGLLFLLVRRSESWDATVEEDHTGVWLRIHGTVDPSVLASVRERVGRGADPLATVTVGAEVPAGAPRVVPGPGEVAGPVPVGGHGSVEDADLLAASLTVPAPLPPAPPSEDVLAAPSTVRLDKAAIDAGDDLGAGPDDGLVDDRTILTPGRRVVAEGRGTGLVLHFDTGARQTVAPLILIGRDPAPADDDERAEEPVLVAVADPDLSVSKTHLSVRREGDGLWVVDRGSTNGTAVQDPQGGLTPVVGATGVRAGVGSTVRFGTRSFLVVEETG